MQEKFSLFYSEDTFSELLAIEIKPEEFINEVLEYNEDGYETLESYSLYYFQNQGGAPSVQYFDICEVEFDFTSLKGKVHCELRVEYHFTCSDFNTEKHDWICWDFLIDKESEEVIFIGQNIPEREPDVF